MAKRDLHPDRVPGVENANPVAVESRVAGYLLNETHPQGWSKAKLFRGFGWDETNLDDLARQFVDRRQGLRGRRRVRTLRAT